MTTKTWTAEEIRALGVRTDLETAGGVLGMGRTKAYDLAKRGQFPCRVLRHGSRYVVPTAGLLRVLELDSEDLTTYPGETTTPGDGRTPDPRRDQAPTRPTCPEVSSTHDGRSSPHRTSNTVVPLRGR